MKKEVGNDNMQGVWARFKTGDQVAFAILYNLHIDNLYSYGTKLCKDDEAVKDAIQELFTELFIKCRKVMIVPENLKFYLFIALKRNLIKKMQSDRKITHDFSEAIDFEPEYSIEFQIIENEREAEITRKVVNAINQLPAKQKEAVYLRYNESLEYDEIAGIMEISVESVRKQVHRGIKTVREIIGKKSDLFLFFI